MISLMLPTTNWDLIICVIIWLFYKEQLVLRGLHYAIIDEVDSVLIDEARTPLIILDRAASLPLYMKCVICWHVR